MEKRDAPPLKSCGGKKAFAHTADCTGSRTAEPAHSRKIIMFDDFLTTAATRRASMRGGSGRLHQARDTVHKR